MTLPAQSRYQDELETLGTETRTYLSRLNEEQTRLTALSTRLSVHPDTSCPHTGTTTGTATGTTTDTTTATTTDPGSVSIIESNPLNNDQDDVTALLKTLVNERGLRSGSNLGLSSTTDSRSDSRLSPRSGSSSLNTGVSAHSFHLLAHISKSLIDAKYRYELANLMRSLVFLVLELFRVIFHLLPDPCLSLSFPSLGQFFTNSLSLPSTPSHTHKHTHSPSLPLSLSLSLLQGSHIQW